MIEVTIQFDSCRKCPFKFRVYEQGYSATECRFWDYWDVSEIKEGTLDRCPFKNKNDEKIKENSSIIVSYNYTE